MDGGATASRQKGAVRCSTRGKASKPFIARRRTARKGGDPPGNQVGVWEAYDRDFLRCCLTAPLIRFI